jgi:hypothetical protein
MKILEPFAGYKLASGHPLLHIAMFLGTFFVNTSEARTIAKTWSHEHLYNLASEFVISFEVIRYAHLFSILFAIPQVVEDWTKH